MARDLIPPPSPAGRPAPDPEPHADPVADATRATEPQMESGGGGDSGPPPFRGRFGFMTGVLLGCVVAAGLVAAALVTTGHGPAEGLAKNWSPWHPKSSDPLGGAEEIAAHIQRQYKSDGRKKGSLVSVRSGPVAYNGLPLSVAVRPAGGDIQILEGIGIQYTLNGLGDGGVIKDGKPSRARNRLLRREALELALYSFRYLPDVSMVVALMPPGKKAEDKKAAAKAAKAAKGKAKAKATPTATPSAADPTGLGLIHQAIFYRPGDLRPQLEVPLINTLDLKTPRVRGLDGDGEEARRIDSLTKSNVFEISYQRAQDAQPYLVLDRP